MNIRGNAGRSCCCYLRHRERNFRSRKSTAAESIRRSRARSPRAMKSLFLDPRTFHLDRGHLQVDHPNLQHKLVFYCFRPPEGSIPKPRRFGTLRGLKAPRRASRNGSGRFGTPDRPVKNTYSYLRRYHLSNPVPGRFGTPSRTASRRRLAGRGCVPDYSAMSQGLETPFGEGMKT